MALFLSTTINNIDKKGRVSVPASFRSSLQHPDFWGVVLFPSLHRTVLEGCSYERMVKLSQHYDTLNMDLNAPPSYPSLLFAEAQFLSFDAEGRISIPQELRDYAGITTQIAFVGRGATFELWNPDAVRHYHETLKQTFKQQEAAAHG